MLTAILLPNRASEASSVEANVYKVVYFINLGLTKLTLASGRRPCVRSVYVGSTKGGWDADDPLVPLSEELKFGSGNKNKEFYPTLRHSNT